MRFILLKKSFKRLICVSIIFFSLVVSAQAQNNSLHFDRSSDYVTISSSASLVVTNKITIETWIKISTTSEFYNILMKGNYGYGLAVAGDKLKWWENSNGATGPYSTTGSLTAGVWTHVAIVVDKSNNTTKFYINGVLDATANTAVINDQTAALYLGTQGTCFCNYYSGNLDELRIWNTARTQSEIKTNMNVELTTATGLIANYHFNQGTAGVTNTGLTSLTDASGNNNTGTLISFALSGNTSNWVASGVTFPTPVISSFTPTSANTGATVTLTGTNFTGTTAVSFGGTPASSFTVVSSTIITAVVASGTSGSISVTSNNSTATKTGFTYNLSSNANLSALSISAGTLSPSFSSGITAYTANVSNATTSITVTPTQADVNASITVNGATVTSGAASSAIALNIGSNTITTIVTAENTSTKTYTLTVTREMTPPGNALNFDGINDYVSLGDVIEGFTTITFEAWVFHVSSGTWDEIYSKSHVNSFGITGEDRLWFHLGTGSAWFAGGGVASSGTILSNTWTHVAATWDGATAKLYINGVLDKTAAHTGAVGSNSNLRGIGGYGSGGINLFSGKIDELRIYDSVLSQSAIAADMVSTSVTSANLIGYYNFDTISSNILIDKSTSNFNGTVINGPTLVESYAMVVPITTAATSISTTGFTANWSAPTIGTVTNYILDVATDTGFTAAVSGSPFTIASPSLTKVITGLSSSSTYYYRVRADKTSFTGQGANSNIFSTATAAASSNANLSALSISAGTLSPSFASGTISYTASVSSATTSITVTPTKADANAIIQVQLNGGGFTTIATASDPLALEEGINTVDVNVAAQDGSTLKIYTITVTRGLVPTMSSFNDQAKYYFDGSYTIVAPISNSSGLLSYTSSDGAVATISGTTVTINGAGSATITATQAGDATYNSGSITYVLTVTAVSVLSKSGGISTTNLNYVNKNGGIGTGIALSRNGAILAAKTPPPIATVGDLRDGGVVFWVDPADNTQGLVCALQDYANLVEWGCYGTDLPSVPTVPWNGPAEGSGAEIGDGEPNTTGILADCSTAPAALAARALGVEWFLPSINELQEMYLHRATLEAVSGFNAFSDYYWSSTESGSQYMWRQDSNGFRGASIKNAPGLVRAVRAF